MRLHLTWLVWLLLVSSCLAGAQTQPADPVQKSRSYVVEMRMPAGGLYAQEETDVEFHVSDAAHEDPVQGAPPVVKAAVAATVTMPIMPSMPVERPSTHSEEAPGDYGVVLFFPHGGDYEIALTISPPGDKPFHVAFHVPVHDADSKRKPVPAPFTLKVSCTPVSPRSGEPAELQLQIVRRATGRPVTEFDTVHEKQIHLMVVSADLSRFAHEHPVASPDGRFTLQYAFPTGGEYHLFADVAPHNAGDQILMATLRVAGPAPPKRAPETWPDSFSDTVDGVMVALTNPPADLTAGRTGAISFSLRVDETTQPITDLEPYLGAMAHLMMINSDGVTFVHCHPDEADPSNGRNGAITFLARFPKPGIYRSWLQFQRGGRVSTATFTWRVGGMKL